MGTPTFIYFCKGMVIKHETDVIHPANLKRSIEKLIAGGEGYVLRSSAMGYHRMNNSYKKEEIIDYPLLAFP